MVAPEIPRRPLLRSDVSMATKTDLPRLDARHALFLDFDGTLAPLQDDADTVLMPAATGEALVRLKSQA